MLGKVVSNLTQRPHQWVWDQSLTWVFEMWAAHADSFTARHKLFIWHNRICKKNKQSKKKSFIMVHRTNKGCVTTVKKEMYALVEFKKTKRTVCCLVWTTVSISSILSEDIFRPRRGQRYSALLEDCQSHHSKPVVKCINNACKQTLLVEFPCRKNCIFN